jgi:hypothetical protein
VPVDDETELLPGEIAEPVAADASEALFEATTAEAIAFLSLVTVSAPEAYDNTAQIRRSG